MGMIGAAFGTDFSTQGTVCLLAVLPGCVCLTQRVHWVTGNDRVSIRNRFQHARDWLCLLAVLQRCVCVTQRVDWVNGNDRPSIRNRFQHPTHCLFAHGGAAVCFCDAASPLGQWE